jgi:hypothetical protein
MFALMAIANRVPLAMYRETDRLFTLVRSTGSLSFIVHPNSLFKFFGVGMLKGALVLIDPAQRTATPYLSEIKVAFHFVLAASTRVNLLPTQKLEDAAAFYTMSFPSLTQLQYIIKNEVKSIVLQRFTDSTADHVTESLRTLLRYVPPHLVTGCSIRAQCTLLVTTLEKKFNHADFSDTARVYRESLLALAEAAASALDTVTDDTLNSYFSNLLKSAPNAETFQTLDRKTKTVTSLIVAEIRHSSSTASNPVISRPPMSVLASLLLRGRMINIKYNVFDTHAKYIKDISRSSLGFVYEDYVGKSASLTEQTLAASDMKQFVDELVKESSNFPSFLSREDVDFSKSWKMTVFTKPNAPGKVDKVERLSNTLKPLGQTDELLDGTVITPTRQIPVAGTTTDDKTYTAIINVIKGSPTDTFCDLISFDYECTKQVDSCLVFRSAPSQPISIIPVQTTISTTKDVSKAGKWVSSFHACLKESFPTKTPVVTAFCVLVPSISATAINSSSVITNVPFVVTEFDPHLDSTCASRYIRAMNAFYTVAMNIALSNGQEPDYSKSYYPSTVPEIADEITDEPRPLVSASDSVYQEAQG